MVFLRPRILFSFVLCFFISTVVQPISGSKIRNWFKKDQTIFLAAFSAAAAHYYLQGTHAKPLAWLRGCITEKDTLRADASYLEKIEIASSDRVRLPKELDTLQNYELVQLKALDQEGPSCAWYMALNAKAIQDCIDNKEPFTAENIKRHLTNRLVPLVKKHEQQFKKLLSVSSIFSGLKIEQTAKLIQHLGIRNHYDVCVRDKGNEVFVSADKSCAAFTGEGVYEMPYKGFCMKYYMKDLYKLLRSIKANQAPVVQIMLTVPSEENTLHAVLLIRINRPNKKPLLVYLNSNGNNLHSQFFDASGTTENAYVRGFIKSLDAA